MNQRKAESSRNDSLRRGVKILGRLAWWVQAAFLILGLGLFLDQAGRLVSDAQFTWGERRVMGLIALIALGGCGLAGWILGQLFRICAGALEALADGTEAARRAGDLIEQHLVPTLGRIALALEERGSMPPAPPLSDGSDQGLSTLKTELAAARSAGRAVRVMDLRDALTQHLRGEPLHAVDRELALWLLKLVERRVQAGTVDAELAGWVARSLDSFGNMAEAEPLHVALPALRRRAGLCLKCGRPLRGEEAACLDCRPGSGASSSPSRAVGDSPPRSSPNRERL
jgi:hypothetical protein